MKRRWITWQHNLLIAVVTIIVTLLALVVGRQIRATLPPGLPDMVGGILLIALAAWLGWIHRGLRSPAGGNGVLALAGVLMLAGY